MTPREREIVTQSLFAARSSIDAALLLLADDDPDPPAPAAAAQPVPMASALPVPPDSAAAVAGRIYGRRARLAPEPVPDDENAVACAA